MAYLLVDDRAKDVLPDRRRMKWPNDVDELLVRLDGCNLDSVIRLPEGESY